MRKSLLIAVDFDGTIVEDKYPGVGKAKPFAIETLKMLQNDGHRLILWTYRHGSKLQGRRKVHGGQRRPALCREPFLPGRSPAPLRRQPKNPCRPLHRRPQLRRFSRMGRDLSEAQQGAEFAIAKKERLVSPRLIVPASRLDGLIGPVKN